MSLSDHNLVARNHTMISQSGLDRGFKCTNDPTGFTVAIVQRQTRPTKAGGLMSVLVQGTATFQDPTSGEVFVATANMTLKVKNSANVAQAKEGLQLACSQVVRQFLPAVDATSNTAFKAVIDNMYMGICPTP